MYNEELHYLYSSLNIISTVKSWRGMFGMGKEMHTKLWSECLKERDHLKI
jgi:hypothetical protein